MKLTLLVNYLLQHIGSRQQVKFRQAYYANVLSLTEAQLKKNIQDIALTIGLHLASLGVESECDGRVYIPESMKITVLIAANLYEVAQAHQVMRIATGDLGRAKIAALRACAKMTLSSEQTIPSKIMQIKVVRGTIAVVVVVKHRNIGTHLDAFRGDLPNALIVMVKLPSMSDVLGADELHSRLKVTRHTPPENSYIYSRLSSPACPSFFTPIMTHMGLKSSPP